MIRISNISFFRFCWKNGKLDWPKCARTISLATDHSYISHFFPAVLWNLVLGPGWAPNEVQSEPTMEYLY